MMLTGVFLVERQGVEARWTEGWERRKLYHVLLRNLCREAGCSKQGLVMGEVGADVMILHGVNLHGELSIKAWVRRSNC